MALCAKAPRRFGKAFAPWRTPLPFPSLNSIGLAELKHVFKRRKNSQNKAECPFRFASRFHLTSSWPSILFAQLANTQFTSDMKKILILPMLIPLAMICSSQKQDSAAEQQLAQQKVELDAREKALDQRLNALDARVNSLDEKVKALGENENSTANAQRVPPGVQDEVPDAAQFQAERERAQQLAAEMRAMVLDRSQGNAAKVEKDRMTRDPRAQAQRQGAQQEPQSQKEYKLQQAQKAWMSGAAVSPGAQAAAPTTSTAVEATSPTPSPAP